MASPIQPGVIVVVRRRQAGTRASQPRWRAPAQRPGAGAAGLRPSRRSRSAPVLLSRGTVGVDRRPGVAWGRQLSEACQAVNRVVSLWVSEMAWKRCRPVLGRPCAWRPAITGRAEMACVGRVSARLRLWSGAAAAAASCPRWLTMNGLFRAGPLSSDVIVEGGAVHRPSRWIVTSSTLAVAASVASPNRGVSSPDQGRAQHSAT